MSNTQRPATTPPPTRRDRREAARRDRSLAAARTAQATPAWRSPMVLLSVGAVAIGLVVILFTSGVLGGRNGGSTGDLLIPIRPTPPELVDPANPRALGPADAPVTIEVWSDFQCPACGFFALKVEPDLIDEYVATGDVHLVYRDLAFLDTPAGSQPKRDGESHQAAAAARCAGNEGKFWEYHDYLFENQNGENDGAFRREVLNQIAATIGLDAAAFDACMGDGTVVDAVIAESDIGNAAGVSSTPTLAINGVLQRAGAIPMDDTSSGPGLRSLIEAELAKVSPAPSATPAP